MKLCAAALCLALLFVLCACSSAESVIFDTDIGSEAGDAIALAWAARSTEVKLIGVTTTGSGTGERAKIAATILKDAGLKKVTVASGETGGAIPAYFNPSLHGDASVDSISAAEFIAEKAKASAKGITLICTGPLTNAAKAIAYPDVKRKIRRIIISGGRYFSHGIEPNIAADPAAAEVVFNSGIPILAAGEDVSTLCVLDEKQRNKLSVSEKSLGKLLYAQVAAESSQGAVYLQDLAAVAIVKNNLVTLEDKHVVIETEGRITRGMTYNETDASALKHTEPFAANARVARPSRRNRSSQRRLPRFYRANNASNSACPLFCTIPRAA